MGEWGNQLLQLLWSARMFYYNVYALVPAAVKGCCPRAPAVSLLLLLSLRRSPGPTLSPVCKDASPMSTVIAGPYWFCHCHQRWNLYLGELWLSYCQCDSFPKHLTSLLRCAVTKWKPLIRIHGWIQLRPRVWIQIRVLCRCGVIAPCLLLLLLVEGIFKWNPGKCANTNTTTNTNKNTNTTVVVLTLRGYCTLPPATPASGGGDLQMESGEMCKVSSCNIAHSHYSKQAITNCK